MFGTLSPHRCTLSTDAHRRYRSYYCGLCQSLGRSAGPLARVALSRDAVFLAIVADGLVDEPSAADSCRCPLVPLRRLPTRSADAVSMGFASGMQLLLGDQKLADRALEGRRSAALVRRLVAGPVGRARENLVRLGIPVDRLEGFEVRQAAVEDSGEVSPRRAAAPTAEALGLVFGSIGALPSAGEDLRTPEVRASLDGLGRALGRAIYLIDALEDLERDRRRGEFNPCLTRGQDGPVVSRPRVRTCCRILDEDLARIRELVDRLPWRRNRPLVDNILLDRLPSTASRAADLARSVACPGSPRPAAAPATGPVWARAAAALTVAAMTLFGWAPSAAAFVTHGRRGIFQGVARLVAGVAGALRGGPDLRAGGKTGSGSTRRSGSGEEGDEGTGTGDGEAPEAAEEEQEVEGRDPGEGAGGTGGDGDEVPVGDGGEGGEAGDGAGEAIQDPCDSCGSCGDACGGCGDSCSGICDDCGSCDAGCERCCEDCCDCEQCCNECGGCDSCCDGCNDCNCG